eukprot:3941032-Rhodomonas_salina.1
MKKKKKKKRVANLGRRGPGQARYGHGMNHMLGETLYDLGTWDVIPVAASRGQLKTVGILIQSPDCAVLVGPYPISVLVAPYPPDCAVLVAPYRISTKGGLKRGTQYPEGNASRLTSDLASVYSMSVPDTA